jgi:hypothetical protein
MVTALHATVITVYFEQAGGDGAGTGLGSVSQKLPTRTPPKASAPKARKLWTCSFSRKLRDRKLRDHIVCSLARLV